MRPVLAVAAVLVFGLVAFLLSSQDRERSADRRTRADEDAAREAGGAGDPAAAERLAIRGRILDMQGEPVAGATVLLRSYRYHGHTRSGPDGAYALAFPAAGSYELSAYHGRYGAASVGILLERSVSGLDLPLQVKSRVRGRVLDRGGAPVPGARVEMRELAWGPAVYATTAGADGRFEIATSHLALHVTARGFAPARLRPRRWDASDLVVVLERGFLLHVLVRDTAGRPQAGAEVRALCGYCLVRATTDGHGRANLRVGRFGPPGEMMVAALAPGHAPVLRKLRRPPSSADSASIVLVSGQGGIVRGTVKEAESGRPIEGVELAASCSEYFEVLPEVTHGRTDAAGAYELRRVPLEADAIYVDHPFFLHEQEWRVIAGGNMGRSFESVFPFGLRETHRDFVLKPKSIARGEVVDQRGQPVEGAIVTGNHSVATDVRGRYEVAYSFEVRATHAVHGEGVVEEYGAEDVPPLVLRPRREGIWIEGRILTDDHKPVPGVGVILTKGENVFIPEIGGGGASNASGVYRMRVAEPGRYNVSCGADGFATTELEVEIRESRTVPDLVLERGPAARGVVVDSEGKPLAGVFVSAHEFVSAVMTDHEGRFRKHGLEHETTLGFHYPGLYANDLSIQPGADEVRVVMRPGAVLRGAVTAAGDPIPDALVTVEPGGECRTNARGEFILADLDPEWLVTVTVDHPLFTSATRELSNPSEGPLAIELEPGRRFRGLVRDEDGNAVADAIVGIGGREARTGGDGHFHVGGLKPGELSARVRVTHLGFAFQPPVSIPAHANDWEFVVVRGATATGKVVADELPSFLEIKAGEHDVLLRYNHQTGTFRTVPLPFHGVPLRFLFDGNEKEIFVRGGATDLEVRPP